MSKTLDIVLLLALPASGKSEVRRFLAQLTPEESRDEFHLGPTVQLDDYPYVHLMRRISQELRARGSDGVFFDSDDLPMKQPLDWGTLIELLNEDYADLVARRRATPASAAEWLLDRFDAARRKVGAAPAFAALAPALRRELAAALEREAAELVAERNAGMPDTLEGKTLVIEFARGGPDGVTPPLPEPLGYQYSLSRLSDAILSRATPLEHFDRRSDRGLAAPFDVCLVGENPRLRRMIDILNEKRVALTRREYPNGLGGDGPLREPLHDRTEPVGAAKKQMVAFGLRQQRLNRCAPQSQLCL